LVSRETQRSAFSLAGATSAWRVESGAVDVFLVHVHDGLVNAPYKHVLRAAEGQLVFGVEPFDLGEDGQFEFWAKGLPGYRLRTTTIGDLMQGDQGPELAVEIDDWINGVTEAVVRDVLPVPRVDLFVAQGNVPTIGAGQTVSARGGVVWLTGLDAASYLGLVDATDDDTEWLPLTLQSWLSFSLETPRVGAKSTGELLALGMLPELLHRFHRRLLDAERLNRILAAVDDANLQLDRSTLRRKDEEQAKLELRHLVEEATAESGILALHGALAAVGDHEGIEFRFPNTEPDYAAGGDPVVEVAFNSRVRARPVRLSSYDAWWFGDNTALLGFRRDAGSPVALLPRRVGRYRLRDPATGKTSKVTRAIASELHDSAWMFIRPFPDRPVRATDALKSLANKIGTDSIRYALAGIAAAFIAFAPAAAIALVVDRLVAESPDFLWLIVGTLVALAATGILVQLLQSTTLLRVEGRVAERLTAALWDRLLRLKRKDLRGLKSGEVAQRAFVFQELREYLSGVVSSTVSTVLFLLPTMGLLYLFDATLATASLAIGTVGLAVVATFGLRQVKWQRRHRQAQQALAGNMFQFVSSIDKLRATGAEGSIYAFWARGYRQKKEAEIRLERLNALARATSASLPMLAAAFLFALVLLRPDRPIEVGVFLAVFAASMTFFAAVTRLGGSVGAVASLFPAYQQAAPLLDRAIEDRDSGESVSIGRIQGDIRLDHVHFSYEDDATAVLQDVSLHVRPGEFVAIVGESGSGKSSLLRLILGLETPSAGAVYVDQRNLRYLDDQALRRQIGVVVQNGCLQPGTILQNIVGINSEATLDDAWTAARRAAVDHDIQAMAMGMHTPVGGHSGLFSGGQVQRILIAAALVRNPTVVLLDEATNWLDNVCQAQVMRCIAEMAATRVVVAHRLSTIRNADRIYVLSHGQVVQTGTFEELAGSPGLFRDLAARQMT